MTFSRASITFDMLIGQIALFKSPNVFNPWNDSDSMDLHDFAYLARRNRLREHLDCLPEFILIGEAPGYQGCHFSGVAFTNEKLIASGQIPRITAGRFTTRPTPWSEPAATVVWKTLHELEIAERTVLWNAFAWHPHQHGNVYTNRQPTRDELIAGTPVLESVLHYMRLYRARPPKIIAVGRVAERTLTRCGVRYDCAVRHPSMGGATIFRQQMQEIAGL